MSKSSTVTLLSTLLVFAVGFYLGFTIFKKGEDDDNRENLEDVTRVEREIQRYVSSTRDTMYVFTEDRSVITNVDSSLVSTVAQGQTTVVRDVVYTVPQGDTVRVYKQAINDSTLTGNMEATVNGTLLDLTLNYRVRYPVVTVTNRDSVVVTTNTTNPFWVRGVFWEVL